MIDTPSSKTLLRDFDARIQQECMEHDALVAEIAKETDWYDRKLSGDNTTREQDISVRLNNRRLKKLRNPSGPRPTKARLDCYLPACGTERF